MENNQELNSSGEKREKKSEIDVIAVAKIGWRRRFRILKVIALFFFLGFIFAILSPKEYTASSTFIPQVSGTSEGGNLGGLASLAGINLGSLGASSEIPPSLYPKIVNSVQFKRALIEAPITLEETNSSLTYSEYYDKVYSPGFLSLSYKYTLGLPRLLLNFFKGEEDVFSEKTKASPAFLRLSKREVELFEKLGQQLEVEPNEKEGIVNIRFTMPEALVAAEMANHVEKLLQKEVIAFKIQNAKEQLRFTQEQFDERKAEFIRKQQELSNFRDKNRNISSAVAMDQLQRLEAEYNFSFNIYSEMAKQLEQAKLQVSKDTPVFSVINPVTVPFEKSAPNRPLIVILFGILGVLVAMGMTVTEYIFKGIRRQWYLK